jgi:hypothetical protein
MLPEAVTAIHAEYNITDTLSMFLAKALSDKVALQHSSISSDLTSETTFLEANYSWQGSTSIDVKEVTAQHAAKTGNLANLFPKLSTLELARIPEATTWPSLPILPS